MLNIHQLSSSCWKPLSSNVMLTLMPIHLKSCTRSQQSMEKLKRFWTIWAAERHCKGMVKTTKKTIAMIKFSWALSIRLKDLNGRQYSLWTRLFVIIHHCSSAPSRKIAAYFSLLLRDRKVHSYIHIHSFNQLLSQYSHTHILERLFVTYETSKSLTVFMPTELDDFVAVDVERPVYNPDATVICEAKQPMSYDQIHFVQICYGKGK